MQTRFKSFTESFLAFLKKYKIPIIIYAIFTIITAINQMLASLQTINRTIFGIFERIQNSNYRQCYVRSGRCYYHLHPNDPPHLPAGIERLWHLL